MEGITQAQLITWLVAMLGGGLAGAGLTIGISACNTRRLGRQRESAIIQAIVAEVDSVTLLCEHNAKLEANSLAPFISLPNAATMRASFEERERYPRLRALQPLIVHYALAVQQINQLISYYRIISPQSGSQGMVAEQRDNLRNSISAVCKGTGRIEGVGPEGFLIFPDFAKRMQKQLVAIQTPNEKQPSAKDLLMPSV